MDKVLLSGETSFKISVPYKLFESGASGEKPLLIYLHGFKQNIEQFRELVDEMLEIEAYHLFIQAPYPIYDRKRRKKVEEWGRAWYLYDGRPEQFVHSLETTSKFLDEVIARVQKEISTNRVAVLGYSMGGYLAGYYGLSRYEKVDDLIVIGARIKTEVFEGNPPPVSKMNVLALHGSADNSVSSAPQQRCCSQLSQWGASVKYKELDESHALSSLFIHECKDWLASLKY